MFNSPINVNNVPSQNLPQQQQQQQQQVPNISQPDDNNNNHFPKKSSHNKAANEAILTKSNSDVVKNSLEKIKQGAMEVRKHLKNSFIQTTDVVKLNAINTVISAHNYATLKNCKTFKGFKENFKHFAHMFSHMCATAAAIITSPLGFLSSLIGIGPLPQALTSIAGRGVGYLLAGTTLVCTVGGIGAIVGAIVIAASPLILGSVLCGGIKNYFLKRKITTALISLAIIDNKMRVDKNNSKLQEQSEAVTKKISTFPANVVAKVEEKIGKQTSQYGEKIIMKPYKELAKNIKNELVNSKKIALKPNEKSNKQKKVGENLNSSFQNKQSQPLSLESQNIQLQKKQSSINLENQPLPNSASVVQKKEFNSNENLAARQKIIELYISYLRDGQRTPAYYIYDKNKRSYHLHWGEKAPNSQPITSVKTVMNAISHNDKLFVHLDPNNSSVVEWKGFTTMEMKELKKEIKEKQKSQLSKAAAMPQKQKRGWDRLKFWKK